jgi:hypothetical protein
LDYLTTHALQITKKGTLASASDKLYQLLAHGRWFSPASSITKTGRHDIAEILLKVALKHQKSKLLNQIYLHTHMPCLTISLTLFPCRKSDISPTSETYWSLLQGYAERGELESMKKVCILCFSMYECFNRNKNQWLNFK